MGPGTHSTRSRTDGAVSRPQRSHWREQASCHGRAETAGFTSTVHGRRYDPSTTPTERCLVRWVSRCGREDTTVVVTADSEGESEKD